MERDARPQMHAHTHYHLTVLPGQPRSVIYWHTHAHQHAPAAQLTEADHHHVWRRHDHTHDRQAMGALTVAHIAA